MKDYTEKAMRFKATLGWALLLLLIPWLTTTAGDRGTGRAAGEKRVALVIGNAAYVDVNLGPLDNPTHDAEDIAKTLKGFGFDVQVQKNLNKLAMEEAIAEFGRRAGNADAALFYFAGHGLQIKSQNYLMPIDATAKSEALATSNGINVNTILEEMDNAHSSINIVMLDACRDNKFSGMFRGGKLRGLAPPTSLPKGTVIVYATDPGNVAMDGDERNGLFTAGLLTGFRAKDVSLDSVLTIASAYVEEKSSQKQTPYVNGPQTVMKQFKFRIEGTVELTPVDPSGPEGLVPNGEHVDRESIFWQSAKDDPELCQEYLRQWPQGVYAALARRCTDKSKTIAQTSPVAPLPLSTPAVPDGKPEPIDREMVTREATPLRETADAQGRLVLELKTGEKVHVLGRTPDEKWYRMTVKSGRKMMDGFVLAEALAEMSAREDGKHKHTDEQKEWQESGQVPPVHPDAQPMAKSTSPNTEPKTGIFFVPVPAGCFQMGSNEYEDTRPVHEVCLDAFEIGKYEVTQGQWKAVTGSNPSEFTACGNDCPVENVSWADTQRFIKHLNGGQCRYRLPTEAEWEYACHAGAQDEQYCGGNHADSVAWYGNNSEGKTHPVGRKAPNKLGIYDMSGNVWEWVLDWYGDRYYANASRENPQGPARGSVRVDRGGSWSNNLAGVRSALRDSYVPDYQNYYLGFRLVRTCP
ncbi:MAG: SUMF1/EgtB/PvdO family nonheme iron enzyme [Magnetococcales bacterium]|nr:SUMF1/EgtB/PvdO family nonheme iron enzyme [Magnetococcales bacterium]